MTASNNLLDFTSGLALHKGGYATPKWMVARMVGNSGVKYRFSPLVGRNADAVVMRRAIEIEGRFTFALEFASDLTAEERRRLALMLGVVTNELVGEECSDDA